MAIRGNILLHQSITAGNDIICVGSDDNCIHSGTLCRNMSSIDCSQVCKPFSVYKDSHRHLDCVSVVCATIPPPHGTVLLYWCRAEQRYTYHTVINLQYAYEVSFNDGVYFPVFNVYLLRFSVDYNSSAVLVDRYCNTSGRCTTSCVTGN